MISSFGGRVIDTAGDGILAEFSSVLNAVNGAVAIQRTSDALGRSSTIADMELGECCDAPTLPPIAP
jgi:class 3 adenylate cyclase